MVRGARNCPFTDFSVIIFRKKLTTTRIAPLSLNSPMRLVIARLNSLLLMIELVRPNLTKARPANEGGGFSWIGRLLSRQSYPERERGRPSNGINRGGDKRREVCPFWSAD